MDSSKRQSFWLHSRRSSWSQLREIYPNQPRLSSAIVGPLRHSEETQLNATLNCSKTYPGERLIGDDVAVAHLDDSAASSRGFRIVGDHDDRLVEAPIEFLKHVQHDG